MLYPPVADLLKNVDSRYLLVNVVAQRARQIASEAEEFQEELTDKPVTLAIREVAEGKLSASLITTKKPVFSNTYNRITENKSNK